MKWPWVWRSTSEKLSAELGFAMKEVLSQQNVVHQLQGEMADLKQYGEWVEKGDSSPWAKALANAPKLEAELAQEKQKSLQMMLERDHANDRYHDLVIKLVTPQLNPVAKIVKSDANAEEQLMAQEREAFSPETYETMKRGLIVDYGLNPEAAEEAAQALWQQMHESLTGDDRSLLNHR